MLRRFAFAGSSCIVMFVFVLGVALPATAHAGPDKELAVKLLGQGDRLLARGDKFMNAGRAEKALSFYEEALQLYNDAYEAFPNPKIYFPIATAEQKLGRYLEAMRHYQEMIKRSEDPSAELIEQVDSAIADVRKNLVALDLIVEQDGATVNVDGKALGVTPLDGPYYMAPGEHKYSVTLEGHTSVEEALDLAPGDVATRQVRLDAMAIVKKKKSSKPSDSTPGLAYEAPSKLPMTLSFGGAGAFVLGATFTAIQAMARHDRYQDETLSSADRAKAQDSGKIYTLATDILLGCAVVSAGYGTYYYYAKYKPKKLEEPSSTSALRIVPYTDGQGAGVALGGSFW